MNPTTQSPVTDDLLNAAALLEAVARDSERAVDPEVPIRCGISANRICALLGLVPYALPDVGDDAVAITRAVDDSIRLLTTHLAADVPDQLLDALQQAQHAAAALRQ
jgi:hypothetical protein